MQTLRTLSNFLFVASLAFLIAACSSLRLEEVDYGWPVETVLKVDQDNKVSDGRYAIAFTVSPIAQEEFNDPFALAGHQLRLLRNSDGFYFVTGTGFKNVYVFEPGPKELRLTNKIVVSQEGLKHPALNLRSPYVELIDDGNFRIQMTNDDIVEDSTRLAEGGK
ncbi:MAG: hypothetical protein HY708_01335 [Ignavibacteriae bacterium]|nr:hypothetical protein [Ignavibacteriota bacterium]